MSESSPTSTSDLDRRRFRLLLVYGLLSLPVVLLGARAALRVNANSPLAWVPETFPARAEFDGFRRMFGSGDVAIVGWDGGTVEDSRINRFTQLLRKSPTFRLADGSPVFEQVISGVEAYDQLLRPPVDLDEEEAARRLCGSLLGPDGVSTCVVVVFDQRALANRARWVALIRATATRHCDVPDDDLHLAGPVLDGLEVDRESQGSLDRFALPSALAVLGMCLLFLPTWRAALVVFLLSVFCELATLALVHFCGDSLNALLIVLPPLIQTAAVSGGIHLVNYYFDSHARGDRDPAGRAIRLAWLPCALSAGTTAIGLASLMVSELAPIRAFGAFGGAGMVLTTALLLTVIPGLFTLWPQAMLRGWKRTVGSRLAGTQTAQLSAGESGGEASGQGLHQSARLSVGQPASLSADGRATPAGIRAVNRGHAGNGTENGSATDELASPVWDWLAGILARWPGVVAATATLAMLACGWGLARLETSVRIETLFGPDSRLIRDYAWLEGTLGPMVPVEVVLHCDPGCRLSPLERLTLVTRLEQELAVLTKGGGTLSAATFTPRLECPPGVDPEKFTRMVNALLDQGRDQLIGVGYLHADRRGESWRITGRVSALAAIDYGAFLQQVEQRLGEVLREASVGLGVGAQPGLQLAAGQSGLAGANPVHPLGKHSDDAAEGLREGAKGGTVGPSASLRLTCTGIMPVVQSIQQQLFDDLLASFVSALVVITLVMIVVQGGVLPGVLSMASNVFPIVLIFGWLGWQRIAVDIGSVLTASVALGIAIDNTLHLLTFFRREVDRGLDPRGALRSAYRHCGDAMVESTLVCLAGTTVFGFASFVPTQRFALLMLGLLLLALIGDLVFLPAILLSPLGRFFRNPADRWTRAATSSQPAQSPHQPPDSPSEGFKTSLGEASTAT